MSEENTLNLDEDQYANDVAIAKAIRAKHCRGSKTMSKAPTMRSSETSMNTSRTTQNAALKRGQTCASISAETSGRFNLPPLLTSPKYAYTENTEDERRPLIPDDLFEDLKGMWAFFVHEYGEEPKDPDALPNESTDNPSNPSPASPQSPLLVPNPKKKRSMKGRRNSLTSAEILTAARGEDPTSAGRVKVKKITAHNIHEFDNFPPDSYVTSVDQVMCPEEYRPPDEVPDPTKQVGKRMTKSKSTSMLGQGDGITVDSDNFRKAITKRLRCAVRGIWTDISKIGVPGHANLSNADKDDDTLNSSRSTGSNSSMDGAFVSAKPVVQSSSDNTLTISSAKNLTVLARTIWNPAEPANNTLGLHSQAIDAIVKKALDAVDPVARRQARQDALPVLTKTASAPVLPKFKNALDPKKFDVESIEPEYWGRNAIHAFREFAEGIADGKGNPADMITLQSRRYDCELCVEAHDVMAPLEIQRMPGCSHPILEKNAMNGITAMMIAMNGRNLAIVNLLREHSVQN
eukprot:gene162-183_t